MGAQNACSEVIMRKIVRMTGIGVKIDAPFENLLARESQIELARKPSLRSYLAK